MATTLELVDEGGVVADFTGATYRITGGMAGLGRLAAVSRVGDRRTISFQLNIVGSSVADLEDKIRTLDNALSVAEYRQRTKQGTQTLLTMQLGDTGANDIEWQVLSGGLSVPASTLNPTFVDQFLQARVTIFLVCERLAHLSTTTITPETLENEVDSNANFMDITWTPTVAGRGGREGLLRVQLANSGASWTGAKKIWIAMRSGERRGDLLFYQAPDSAVDGEDPSNDDTSTRTKGTTGGLTANASGGASAFYKVQNLAGAGKSLQTTYTNVAYWQFDISTIPKGQFLVLARCSVEILSSGSPAFTVDDMGFALGYAFGGVPDVVPVAADDVKMAGFGEDEWHVLDLGLLDLPPTAIPETTYTDPTLNLRIYATYQDAAGVANSIPNTEYLEWALDHIWLFPTDENSIVVSAVDTDDEIVIDSFSNPPGVYIVNSSDVVQKFADFSGNPRWTIGPENDLRLMWLRDDEGDPTTVAALMSPFTIGRVEGM